ncbi:site-2 protease family protein [Candidatus Saccharibacteria bacterium]|nr:site-2 protease family protein [Candidatus Saccharibacteria bacterium]
MFTVIIIILLFASLVLLHELGHFIMARRNGVEAEEFGVGFPPKLYGKQIGKTFYSINLLPLGGFVRMKGEDAADTEPGSFGAASFGSQTKILFAGVVMNLLTAVVLLYVLALTGLPGLGPQFEPTFLHSTYAQPKQLLLVEVVPGSPAAQAGLKRGDYVLTANGTMLTTDVQLSDFTRNHAGETVSLGVKTASGTHVAQIKLLPPTAKDGYLGVSSQQIYKLRYDPLRAVVAAGYITFVLLWETLLGVFSLFWHFPSLIAGLFGHGVPAAAEATSGPIGIVFILKSISTLGWSYVVLFMANISVALAAFNILPLPALDGGRWFVLAVQKVTGRKWSADAEARYHAVGFLCLIGLMVLISVYDVRKFF